MAEEPENELRRAIQKLNADEDQDQPLSEESEFIQIFVRRCNNDTALAIKAVQEYNSVRKECINVFACYNLPNVLKVLELGLAGVLPDVSALGNVLIYKLGHWTIGECSIFDIVAVINILLEIVCLDAERQKIGFVTLFDTEGLKMAHMKEMTKKVRKELDRVNKVYLQMKQNRQLVFNMKSEVMGKAFCSFITVLGDGVKTQNVAKHDAATLGPFFGSDFVEKLPVEYGGKNDSWLQYSRELINTKGKYFLKEA